MILLVFSMIVFAQEKTFQLLYDYHQKGELAAEVKKRNPAHINEMAEEALNKSFEVELLVNHNYSLVKVLPRVSNNQSGNYLEILPEPSWLLIDFNKEEYYHQIHDLFVKGSIEEFKFSPTKNKKIILGLEAKEFKFEDENKSHSIWLTKQSDLAASPSFIQPKGYLVMLYHVFYKDMAVKGGHREFTYQLKEIKETKLTDLSKQIPKKSISKKEFDEHMKRLMENEEIDKD